MEKEYKNLVLGCQNCKSDFTIEPEDFSFYEKIKVPPPTFCPECRMIRRMIWRNERSLYRRKCSATGKSIISMYTEDVPFPVYDRDYWWSDAWDSLSFGRNYDFSRPFFEQFRELYNSVPQASFFGINLDDCNYCNFFSDSKSCYSCFGGGQNQNLLYCGSQVFSKDSVDITLGNKNELSYDDFDCFGSYGLIGSIHSESCVDSGFLSDCRGLNNCIGCVNLTKKSNYVWNEPKSKDEYESMKAEIFNGSYKSYQDAKSFFKEHKLKYPVKYVHITNSPDCTGDNIKNSKNSKHCFNATGVENCKYLTWSAGTTKDSYDCVGVGMGAEMIYEGVSNVYELNSVLFSMQCQHGGVNLQYCVTCYGSSNLFGCIGLRSKQYCIFNKQYTKEEYEKLVPRIIQQMNEIPYEDTSGLKYKYGEFFPAEFSPFAYNETIAQEYYPFDKKYAEKMGYRWKDVQDRDLNIDIKNEEMPDNIHDVDSSWVGKVIECAHKGTCNEQCTEAFKILPEELQFYIRMNLPLPRLCPNCRHYQRLSNRNPLRLWHRACMCDKSGHASHQGKCEVEFETSYAPERPEIVYCERCYQNEVY